MASARIFLLMVCVGMVFCRSVGAADLFGTLQSDGRFKIIAKGFTDIQEVEALKSRSAGSAPFVFVGQTDESVQSGIGPEAFSCVTSPEHVKNEFAQLLRYLQVSPLSKPVKSPADLFTIAKENGGRLWTVNGQPIFVEQAIQAGQATIVLSGDENSDFYSATVEEVREINTNVSLVILKNGFLIPPQLDEQIVKECNLALPSGSLPAVPSSAAVSSKAPASSPSSNPVAAPTTSKTTKKTEYVPTDYSELLKQGRRLRF